MPRKPVLVRPTSPPTDLISNAHTGKPTLSKCTNSEHPHLPPLIHGKIISRVCSSSKLPWVCEWTAALGLTPCGDFQIKFSVPVSGFSSQILLG